MSPETTVLFVCAHNANRSQIAAGYAHQLAQGRLNVVSAGSTPAERLNPVAVEVMAEDGIDISHVQPALLTHEVVSSATVIITLGCLDAITDAGGKRHEDWVLPDPTGRGPDSLRPLRNEIKSRVEDLVASLT